MFKVNEYLDGNVTSIAFSTAESPAAVGVMAKGDYVISVSIPRR